MKITINNSIVQDLSLPPSTFHLYCILTIHKKLCIKEINELCHSPNTNLKSLKILVKKGLITKEKRNTKLIYYSIKEEVNI